MVKITKTAYNTGISQFKKFANPKNDMAKTT